MWRQEKQEPKTRPAISRLCMALIGLCALTQPDRHPQPTAPSRTSAKGFARPLFEGHFKFCPLLEKIEEGTVSKKEPSSCHTSNTKLKEFDMTRRRTFEILTFEAAAVSITCQETPNRTSSPFDELASRTNDIIDRKRFPCDRKSSPVFFAVTRQCFRATRNLSRYCNWCSLDCVHEIDLPDFTVAYSPRNHSS